MENINRTIQAKRVTWYGFVANCLLSVGKIVAGIFGHSAAMVTDGVHSLSDFVTDFIVLLFISVSSKEKDEGHDYGHGKFETFATLIVSIVLLCVGVAFFYSGAIKVYGVFVGNNTILAPSFVALMAAIVSIVVKECLYRYTVKVGKRIKSDVVIANGWHHRTDALSSIGTLLGISGAMFLGEKWTILDPIASIVVAGFIVAAALKLSIPAIRELLESSLSHEIEAEITATILSTQGVKDMHNLKTRKIGSYYIIDVHIKVDPHLSVVAGHDIASAVERNLCKRYGREVQTSIHIEPFYGDVLCEK